MSYNGSGTFNINSTGQPVVSGTIISAATFNALTADLATGLTTALTKDGQTTATARIPFAAGISSTLVTDASSTSTGSIITDGGVGIAKKLYVGTDANIGGLTASSAVATDASKNLVSVTNTGTGSNVLATAPTIASLNLTTALTLASAAGTNGQVLTSAGSGLPTWTTPAVSALTLLSTVTASGAATASIETTFDSTYTTYLIVADSVKCTVDNSIFRCKLKIGGSYLSADYAFKVDVSASDNTTYSGISSDSGGLINIIDSVSNASAANLNFSMFVRHPSSTTLQKQVDWTGASCKGVTPVVRTSRGVGTNTGTAALTGVQFFADSGNISGTFRLYGIAN